MLSVSQSGPYTKLQMYFTHTSQYGLCSIADSQIKRSASKKRRANSKILQKLWSNNPFSLICHLSTHLKEPAEFLTFLHPGCRREKRPPLPILCSWGWQLFTSPKPPVLINPPVCPSPPRICSSNPRPCPVKNENGRRDQNELEIYFLAILKKLFWQLTISSLLYFVKHNV